jgi:hypothetical protein
LLAAASGLLPTSTLLRRVRCAGDTPLTRF